MRRLVHASSSSFRGCRQKNLQNGGEYGFRVDVRYGGAAESDPHVPLSYSLLHLPLLWGCFFPPAVTLCTLPPCGSRALGSSLGLSANTRTGHHLEMDSGVGVQPGNRFRCPWQLPHTTGAALCLLSSCHPNSAIEPGNTVLCSPCLPFLHPPPSPGDEVKSAERFGSTYTLPVSRGLSLRPRTGQVTGSGFLTLFLHDHIPGLPVR